jgi:hypothetical protein
MCLEQVKPQLRRSRPAVPSQIISANFADLFVR